MPSHPYRTVPRAESCRSGTAVGPGLRLSTSPFLLPNAVLTCLFSTAQVLRHHFYRRLFRQPQAPPSPHFLDPFFRRSSVRSSSRLACPSWLSSTSRSTGGELVPPLQPLQLTADSDSPFLRSSMIQAGFDTFPEAWDPLKPRFSPYGSFASMSFCHAWSCTPALLLRRLGLE